MLRIISWTGWTEDDWKLFGRYIRHLPGKLIRKCAEKVYDAGYFIAKGEIR